MDWSALADAGLGLIGTITKMIADAKAASAEQHQAILDRLNAAEDALSKVQVDAHAAVDEETAKTEVALTEAASMPTPGEIK